MKARSRDQGRTAGVGSVKETFAGVRGNGRVRLVGHGGAPLFWPHAYFAGGAGARLHHPIIRHDDFGALVSAAFFGKRVMVSPSGTRGVGSTKVRAGRRQTLA